MRTLQFIVLATTIVCTAAFASSQTKPSNPDTSSKVSDSAPESSTDEAFVGYQRVTAGITPPKEKFHPDPKFPDLPPYAEPHGLVVMLIGVNEQGRVVPIHVLRSSGKEFEESAVQTVRKWKFKPAIKEGKPVPVQITVEMTFRR